MLLRDVVRVLFRHLLDVDAAHVAEDGDRLLGERVVGDAQVVLLANGRLLLDEDTTRELALDLEREDLGGGRFRLGRCVGELHATRLHAAAREHLRLEDDGAVDLASEPLGLLRRCG